MYIKYLFILCMSIHAHTCHGQQTVQNSHINDSRAYFNPALTASSNKTVVDGFFRLQWLGFSGAPRSGYVSYQMPVAKNNMAAGGFIHFDQTGPISKTGLKLNYAYKLNGISGKYSQLALGMTGDIQQYSFGSTDLIVTDLDDQLINGGTNSALFYGFGMGFQYITNTREYKGSTFYIGGALNQLASIAPNINGSNQNRVLHSHLNIGGKWFGYDDYIEPSFVFQITTPAILDILFNVKYEKEDTFWCGIGITNASNLGIQAGVILPNIGEQEASLRIGVLGGFGIGSDISKFGSSTELYLAYVFEK